MRTKIRLQAIAYFKGVLAAKEKRKPNNPYENERLAQWWEYGYEDETNGLIVKEIFK